MKLVSLRSLFLLLWLSSITAGGWVLLRHEKTAGAIGATPSNWPEDAKVELSGQNPVLLVFAHPHCPCTRASVSELSRVLAKTASPVDVHVFFLRPNGMPDGWERTASWKSAAAIPGVRVHVDPDGIEAARFGALTSGFVVLYSARGELLFNGGITAGRGHEGDNAGATTVLALLNRDEISNRQGPVFGCGLKDCNQTLQ